MILKKVAIITAHPDDETLWAGGTILDHPSWQCVIICLCRGSDIDRAPKFYRVMDILKSEGIMGDLDDGPDQIPLQESAVEEAILELFPKRHFDIIITHNPTGEYTSHIRHNEVGQAVIRLWVQRKIEADELWAFAYEDGHKKYFPRALKSATSYHKLARKTWLTKYNIIIETYGFNTDSFEARTTPAAESFWQFNDPHKASGWLNRLSHQL